MLEKKKIRNGQEWLALIQECRASGLSGREWCRMHSIPAKTFYNKVSELRKKACGIPESETGSTGRKQDVVPVELVKNTAFFTKNTADDTLPAPPARVPVTVRMSGCSIEITQGASEETIRNTLLALGRLC